MIGHPRVRLTEIRTALQEGVHIARLHRLQYREHAYQERYQREKLGPALSLAHRDIPFYHERWGRPPSGDPIAALSLLPVITKDDVVRNPDRFMNPAFDPASTFRNRTSGSAGTPSTFHFDWPCARIGKAQHNFTMLESGMRTWHRIGRDYARQAKPKRWYENLGHMRVEWYSTFEPPGVSARRMSKKPPHVLYFCISILQLIGRAAEDEGLEIRPELILTNGETVFDSQRREVERIFGAPIRDQYGSAEFPRVAWECDAGRYHMLPEQVVEVLDRDGELVAPGEAGRIVVTDLNNRAMPLIRYDTGDVGVRSGEDMCPCGRTLPSLESVEGKDDYFVVDGDGRRYSPRVLTGCLARSPQIMIFECHQDRPGQLLVQLLLGEPSDPNNLVGVRELREGFGDSMDVEVEIVDDLPLHGSGKRRILRSKVAAARMSPEQIVDTKRIFTW
jgi:phenylacetate-CoA ligase